MAQLYTRFRGNLPLIIVVAVCVYIILMIQSEKEEDNIGTTRAIHLGVVACEGKTKRVLFESLTMIKSALIFTKSFIHVHIFTETFSTELKQEFLQWPESIRAKFKVSIYPVNYPLASADIAELKNWWGPCASYRLFLPHILPKLDSIIYVDSDVLFLGPVDEIWDQFRNFKDQHVGALASRVGWDFKVVPNNPNFILKPDGRLTQVNSGVFLMNLTRMRERRFVTDPEISSEVTSWDKEILLPLYHKYKKEMYGDQNLINIIFHYNSDLLYFLPCKYNYHHKFCFDKTPDRWCDSAEESGAAVVHGSANTFYNNYAPAFAAINKAMKQYNFEKDLEDNLLQPMITNLQDPDVEHHEHCGGKTELLTRHLRKSIQL